MMALFVALLTALLLASEGPEPVKPIPPSVSVPFDGQLVTGSLFAHTIREPYNRPDGLLLEAFGIVEGFENERITISHYREVDLLKDGTTKILRESFRIDIDQKNKLFGTYSGFARMDNNQFTAEWMLEVTGGLGDYANATGNFIEAIGVVEGSAGSVYKIDFSGTIFTR